jgi:hypothetical protein
MSLMKLAPETVRLRRAARALASGEFSLDEYRRARREVIENFAAGQPTDDDTQRRTVRRSDLPKLTSAAQPEPAPRPTGYRRWLIWLVAAFALAGAMQLFAATGPVIGPVSERDPNPATSPRLDVQGAVLGKGAEMLTLDGAELQAVIDAKVGEIRTRNRPGGHGFTPAELEEVGRLLNALGAHDPDVQLNQQDLADLSALLKDQKTRRGISIAELEEVAAAVQSHLRDAGYFLAVAFVPSQTVVDGQVRVDVLPGVVGDVVVSGASDRLVRRFDDLLGRPLKEREVNTRLYALNQAPGFTARASFQPGDAVGETDLHLEVLEASALRGRVAVDNHGDDQTGKERIRLSGDLINPAGRGDILSLGLTAALDPSNQVYGYARYATPFGARRTVRGRLARNDFSTDTEDGDGWLLDAVVETHLDRDRRTGLSYEVGLGVHSLAWDLADGSLDQDVLLFGGAVNGRRVWDRTRIATDFRVYADVGRIDGDTFAGQESSFWDAGFDVFAWHPFDLGMLPGRQKLSVVARGQYAGSHLPATRRMAMGGVSAARGFDRDVFLADRGVFLSIDLRTPLALGELFLFADGAYGKDLNDLYPAWAHLADLGVGWDVRFGPGFSSSLSLAYPITAKGTDGLDDDGARLFWSLSYEP